MTDIMINGIPVSFPFVPYDVQKIYMEKVIECLQNAHNGVLESPTGTGKTLSLLCSSLAWLLVKKAQIQIGIQTTNGVGDFAGFLEKSLKKSAGKQNKSENTHSWGMPKIIYASRTHSQLSQVMQELKRTSYRHVKAALLGSRDQMCIHPEVSKETNNTNKIHMCQAKVKTRTCFFYTNVENKKEDISIKDNTILDIEDLVKVGKKLTCCPYYLSKELKQTADIIFMPYNYLLDPKARKANGVELANNVVILDEAHNVEHICEESASLQIKSTDIALCIDEITYIMKSMSESNEGLDFNQPDSQPKDFTPDDLCTLKEIFLTLEKTIDDIEIPSNEGVTFNGSYIFDLLMKAQICESNFSVLLHVIDKIIDYLSTVNSTSLFQRKGTGLEKFSDLLNILFNNTQRLHKQRIIDSYKVHIQIEDKKTKKSDSWSIKGNNGKTSERILSLWCFSPGFGIKQLLDQQVRCIIFTSGTLAPLEPLISELAIPISVRLENPHIITENQIFVKIITNGPDSELLNSNFQNRNNPKYITSLGRTILSFSRVIPDGLLIFFPSYPILSKCQEIWQLNGIWSNICNIKPIYVEPQRKDTFNATMSEFYSKINDTNSRGACFMAVCRGKVSEGLDFADMNGRGVIITGLPFPPFKDPRIVLKKKYLEEQRKKNKDNLSGDDWYSLEASRAVNQAIGRVIRHKNDFGAILLCDNRFDNPRLKTKLSKWVKDYCAVSKKFGETVGDLCRFFKNAEKNLPSARLKQININDDFVSEYENYTSAHTTQKKIIPKRKIENSLSIPPKSNEVVCDIDFYKNASKSEFINNKIPQKASELFSALDDVSYSASHKLHKSSKIENNSLTSVIEPSIKRKKYKIISNFEIEKKVVLQNRKVAPEDLSEFVKCVKSSLEKDMYKLFQTSISSYKITNNLETFLEILDKIFYSDEKLHFLLKGMERFLKGSHKNNFKTYCEKLS